MCMHGCNEQFMPLASLRRLKSAAECGCEVQNTLSNHIFCILAWVSTSPRVTWVYVSESYTCTRLAGGCLSGR
jgi:hypothetical protein